MQVRRVVEGLGSVRAQTVLILFAGFFFVRTCLMPLMGDDYGYAFIWDGAHGGNLAGMAFGSADIEVRHRVESFADLVQSQWSHYMTWGGRAIAHTLIQTFIWLGKPLFDVANAIVFVALILAVLKLAGVRLKSATLSLLWMFACLFVLTKFSVVSMIYLTGSCNYMWAALCQAAFVIPFVEALRSNAAATSRRKNFLMAVLGIFAGWSNEAGALATICLAAFLIVVCRSRGLLRPWMTVGFAAAVVGCAVMFLAPGNFVRLELTHAGYHYSAAIFLHHLTDPFVKVVSVDAIALIPMFAYFLTRRTVGLNTSEILMLAFTAAGLIVPSAMLFSPEFSVYISLPSMIFVLVAATIALNELRVPVKFLRTASAILLTALVAYFATLIYVDISLYKDAQRQIEFIRTHRDIDPVPISPMRVRHRFDWLHAQSSVVPYVTHFAGVEPKFESSWNSCVAQYYGAHYVFAVDE
ncbi:MAG: hypothetical protein SR2Q5_02030 [Quinella sp. 2Q5]|nr:hypothetical protein [Quinella sp. 2Q5]